MTAEKAGSGETLERLAEEQAALLRLATLVADGAPPQEIFSAVSDEVARLFACNGLVLRFEEDGLGIVSVGVSSGNEIPSGTRWEFEEGMASLEVYRTGGSARVDGFDWSSGSGPAAETAERVGIASSVSNPILVQNRLWGAVTVFSTSGRLPDETEERLEKFSQLVATAIANAESREAVSRTRQALELVAAEHAALRRVATLVAAGAMPAEVFGAAAEEAQRILELPLVVMSRYEADGTATVVAASGEHAFQPGTSWPLDGPAVSALVRATGRPASVDYADVPGAIGQAARAGELSSGLGVPIVVNGSVWGVMVTASSGRHPLPPDTEARLADFTDLVATAISNADSRVAIDRLANEQAALRRVATLVAEGTAPTGLFAAVAVEVAAVVGVSSGSVSRFLPDGSSVVLASHNDPGFPVGSRWRPDEGTMNAGILEAARPARVDQKVLSGPIAEASRISDVRSAVGAPIVVEGSVWGMVAVGRQHSDEPLPPQTEARLAAFTELIATAIANAESRDELTLLADEQAALRHVATLVARDAPSTEVFEAVAMAVGKLFDTDITVIGRYDGDGALTAIGNWSASPGGVPVGTRSVVGGRNVLTMVAESGKPARMDEYDDASGEAAEIARRHGWRSAIGAPIAVEGRLWGVMLVATQRSEPFPAGAEERLENFTELVATAIANAESKSELAASRRRIVAASDETRRQIERNLHDGTQQRLVSLRLALRAAEANLPPERDDLRAQLSDVATGLAAAVEDLQEISRGIHPAILSRGGLGPALRALALRSAIPVDLDIATDMRVEEPTEVAAYFVASEALANAAKHSDASQIDISLEQCDGRLLLSVRDDGIGGADAARGSGLVGLRDRVEALGGSIRVSSLPGKGTKIAVELPVGLDFPQSPG